MNGFRVFLRWLVAGIVLVGAGVFVVSNYSWVFAKRVRGHIVSVERVTDPNAFVGARVTEAQMHSYAILIEDLKGHMYTASSEDPKWQVAQKGYCVEATLYVYPPWNLSKANNYFNARLDELSRACEGEAVPTGAKPTELNPSAAPATGEVKTVEPTSPAKEALPSSPSASPTGH